jgi:hypothetical protein
MSKSQCTKNSVLKNILVKRTFLSVNRNLKGKYSKKHVARHERRCSTLKMVKETLELAGAAEMRRKRRHYMKISMIL